MKVIYYNTLSGYLNYGGAEVQIEHTIKELEKKGVKIIKFSMWDKDIFNGAKILHIFHLDICSIELIKFAKEKNIKVVVTPIFWPKRNLILEKLFISLPILRSFNCDYFNFRRRQKEILSLADSVIASSISEANIINKLFLIEKSKLEVIPVGVPNLEPELKEEFSIKRAYNIENFILNVGRVEPRKNQYRLILAAKELGLPILIIGKYYSNDKYYRKCRNINHDQAIFIGAIEHNSDILIAAYRECLMFALPSFFETPGLAAMEAAKFGKSIVITKYGNTREYFLDYVSYVDPYSVKSIKEGVLRALNQEEKRKLLPEFIVNNYNWGNIVERLIKVYISLIE